MACDNVYCEIEQKYFMNHHREPFTIKALEDHINIYIKLSIDGIGCIVLQFFCAIYVSLANKILFLRHVYKTMFSQALFMFESFSAIIALKNLLLGVGYFVASQITL